MSFSRFVPTFRRNALSPYSGLRMKLCIIDSVGARYTGRVMQYRCSFHVSSVNSVARGVRIGPEVRTCSAQELTQNLICKQKLSSGSKRACQERNYLLCN